MEDIILKKYIVRILLVLISLSLLTSCSTKEKSNNSTYNYSETQVDEIIIEYNKIISTILTLSNNIEKSSITEDNFNDFFSDKLELVDNSKICYADSDIYLFTLGNEYNFYPNGFNYKSIGNSDNIVGYFHINVGLNGIIEDSFFTWEIHFKKEAYKWIIDEIHVNK